LAELKALYQRLSSREIISRDEALAVLGKLAAVEKNMNEEEYVKLLIPLLSNVLRGECLGSTTAY